MSSDADTATILEGFVQGVPVLIDGAEVECGHYMRKDVAAQVRDCVSAARDDGILVSINSAFRTWEKQEVLYQLHKQNPAKYAPAERPGYSKHQEGTAIDLHFPQGDWARERFAAIALAHGLTRPVPGEPWHFFAAPQREDMT